MLACLSPKTLAAKEMEEKCVVIPLDKSLTSISWAVICTNLKNNGFYSITNIF